MPKVKCADCGFLAIRDEYTEDVKEATRRVRERGEAVTSAQNTHRAKVFCYEGVRRMLPLNMDAQQVAAMVNEEIECGEFRKWSEGKTPKEHEEMTILEQVKEENATARQEDIRRQKQWREEDLEWRKEVEDGIDRRFREAEDRKESHFRESEGRKESHFWQSHIFQILVGIILLLAGTILGILVR